MKFVNNLKSSWRWFSMQAMALNTAFLLTWGLLPEKFQDSISPTWVAGIAVVLMVLGMIGRTIKQEDAGKP